MAPGRTITAAGRWYEASTSFASASMSVVSPCAVNQPDAMGSGHNLSVACTITPRVPSEPTMRRGRSNPVTSLTVRPPPVTTRPSPVATTTSMSESRTAPWRSRARPVRAPARMPPTVAPGVMSAWAQRWPLPASSAATSVASVPPSTVTIMSAGA